MTADDLHPTTPDDGPEPAIAGSLRVLLAAHVDDDTATDATWTEVERRAAARRSARSRRRTTAVAVLAVAALLVVFVVIRLEVTRDEDVQVTVADDPTTIPDPTEGADADSWVRLLAHIPELDLGDRPVAIYDLARARRDAFIDVLDPAPTEQAWIDHSFATFGVPDVLTYAVGPAASPDELRAELGIGHEQFDQVITYSEGTPLIRYVAIGRFDPAAIAAAVAVDPQWSPMLETRRYRGITYYRWGEDYTLHRQSPARDLGNGGRLVVGDGWVSWTYADAEAEATIDAWLDPQTSLATVEPIRSAVDLGDTEGLTQLAVGRYTPRSTSASTITDPLAGLPAIDRPLTWSRGAVGTDVDVEQHVIGYATPEQARANLDAYATSWRQFASGAVDAVEQQGTGLTATIRLPEPTGEPSPPGLVSDGSTDRYAGSFLLYFNIGP